MYFPERLIFSLRLPSKKMLFILSFYLFFFFFVHKLSGHRSVVMLWSPAVTSGSQLMELYFWRTLEIEKKRID